MPMRSRDEEEREDEGEMGFFKGRVRIQGRGEEISGGRNEEQEKMKAEATKGQDKEC